MVAEAGRLDAELKRRAVKPSGAGGSSAGLFVLGDLVMTGAESGVGKPFTEEAEEIAVECCIGNPSNCGTAAALGVTCSEPLDGEADRTAKTTACAGVKSWGRMPSAGTTGPSPSTVTG